MNFKTLAGTAVLFVLACAAGEQKGKPQTGLEVKTLVIEKSGGEKAEISAEIARTPEERNTGLMFRTALEDGKGMLFVFDRDEVLSFWMKNTLIPLSIAFIAYDGKVLEIRDMVPGDLRSIQSGRSVRYALEAPRGWFSRAGIAPGDTIRLPVYGSPE